MKKNLQLKLIQIFLSVAIFGCAPGGGSPTTTPPATPPPAAPPSETPPETSSGAQVLWADVSPLLQQKCTLCHEDRGLPPRLLFREVGLTRNMGSSIVSAIESRRMPRPPEVLDASEIELIKTWVVSGGPE